MSNQQVLGAALLVHQPPIMPRYLIEDLLVDIRLEFQRFRPVYGDSLDVGRAFELAQLPPMGREEDQLIELGQAHRSLGTTAHFQMGRISQLFLNIVIQPLDGSLVYPFRLETLDLYERAHDVIVSAIVQPKASGELSP